MMVTSHSKCIHGLEQLKVAIRTGNYTDQRALDVHQVSITFRDTRGQAYRVCPTRPETLRQLLCDEVVELLNPESSWPQDTDG